MSKKFRLPATALLALLLILATVFTDMSRLLAQSAGSGAAVAAPGNTRNAAVVAATEAVLKETSELRELPILRPVKSGTQSRAEIEKFLIKNMDEDSSPEEMHASEVALKKLGLVPANFEFRSFIIKLLTEQVAGYYDPKNQQFYLADWIDLDGQQPVMAHELTHALQDQHFNLRRFEKWPKGDSDAELAAHALVEGDASLAMAVYVARNPLRIISLMKSMGASGANTELIDSAPRAIRESLLFPYEQGMQWAQALYRREGWPLISKAYKELPQSTEQILHVEKYFAREAPLKINLQDIAAVLGAGWKRLDYDTNGEWSYYLILDEFLKSRDESRRAAAGWGGDRYSVYEDPKTGRVLIAHLSAWDTEEDALEFFNAYAKRTERRYQSIEPISSSASKSPTEDKSWRTNEGLVFMERRGVRVLVVEGVPEGKSAQQVIAKLWQ